ncbi:MAG: guanine deaminase [Betaproteobacteria bacterium]|nr:guanine deaminase [Betaproteobacteria bacterium]
MKPHTPALRAYRGSLLHFLGDPGDGDATSAVRYFDDGLLIVENGLVKAADDARLLLPTLPAGAQIADYSGRLLLPGFIDTHIHYPQTDMIAAYAAQLLDWLDDHAFPAEHRFADAEHAAECSRFFLDELMRNGTTTALVFGTVHPCSVDAFFAEAEKRNLRMIAGKVLMDRNCPEYLRDTPDSGYRDSATLIEKWDGRGRLHYAITPRFAVTSSEAQLESAGRLAIEHPGVFVHSHVAENLNEVKWARELFPQARSYLDIYERFGLLRDRSVYAHCIHLDDEDRRRMAHTGAAAAVCATSNLFLGSGLFDFAAARHAGMRTGLGTDVGGGTSFSMLRTLGETYKVAQMRGHRLTPWRGFYLATLGGARALGLGERIGSFAPGREADFVVLRMDSTPLIARRMKTARTPAEKLFALMMLGDDREVGATYIMGNRVWGSL